MFSLLDMKMLKSNKVEASSRSISLNFNLRCTENVKMCREQQLCVRFCSHHILTRVQTHGKMESICKIN